MRKFIEKQTNPNYTHMLKGRRTLPAWNMMKTILETADKSQVCIYFEVKNERLLLPN